MQQWFYARGDEDVGPVSLDSLRRLAATGGIDASTLVWTEGMEEWLPASSIAGLSFGGGAPRSAMPSGGGVSRQPRSGAVSRGGEDDREERSSRHRSGSSMPVRVVLAGIIALLWSLGGFSGCWRWFQANQIAIAETGSGDAQFMVLMIQSGSRGLLYLMGAIGALSRQRWGRSLIFAACILDILFGALILARGISLVPEGSLPEGMAGLAAVILLIIAVIGALPALLLLGGKVSDWFGVGSFKGRGLSAHRAARGGNSGSARQVRGAPGGGVARASAAQSRPGTAVRRSGRSGARRGGRRR